MTGGALLVAGTTSDAGKSVVTAGLCRWLARQGLRVAPFKAQNMALNSVVTADGAEIGRAQAMQAAAAGVEPEAAMNPVLLKPGDDRHSQLIVLGRPVAEVDALSYRPHKAHLAAVVADCLADLRARFDAVICEGAGSPAEINLRDTDIANMGLARAANLPVLVVGDIDRGGVFAALFGTLALLDAADQALIAGWIINKFRGDPRLLEPGLRQLERLTGRPVHGVLPWRSGLWLDVEDSLDLASYPGELPPTEAADRSAGRGGEQGGVPAGGGDPVAAAVQRHRHRPAAGRTRGGCGVRDPTRRPPRRRPGRHTRDARDRGGPGLAARMRPGRDTAGTRGRWPAGPRDLRRIPDARPAHPRSGRVRYRDGERPRPATGDHHVRPGQSCSAGAPA